ncbi:MAG: glycoside hydrolase family 88 protein [Terracidiphilus sp.]|nr:glycoside hydrolase family 88 protein [Terracidiphilus sp.]MDR3775463.1 glycoside hydrolase family 88 protein [Terracidiphilus sp.]
MNRRSFLHTAAVLGVPLAGVQAMAQALHVSGDKGRPDSASARQIQKATAAGLAMQRRDWEQGILAQALLEAGDRENVILLTKAAIVQRTPDGRLGVVLSGGPTDPAMGGAAYAKAAEWTGDPQLRQAVDGLLEWIRHKAPRSADGVLYHVFGAPEMWSDGFNGAPPFLAAAGFYDEALAQIEGFKKRLWNPQKQLLAHIWDDGKRQFKDGDFWGSGNGWAAAGLARVIRSLPAERRTDRERLAAFAREIVDGCLRCQRADGLFHNVVDQPGTFVETNLAQMLGYAVYEGVAGGWLPKNYRAHADKMRAAARAKMDAYGYVQGACSAPNFDCPGTSTEAQAFCILMETASSRTEAARTAKS